MKIIKSFMGCADGEVYPVEYKKGEECPPELVAAARELGCIDERKLTKKEQEEADRIAAEEAARIEAEKAARLAAEAASGTGA